MTNVDRAAIRARFFYAHEPVGRRGGPAARADFIAHASGDIAALLAALDKCDQHLAALQEQDEAQLAEIVLLLEQRDAVLTLHHKVAPSSWEVGAGKTWCAADSEPWPCETARALGAES